MTKTLTVHVAVDADGAKFGEKTWLSGRRWRRKRHNRSLSAPVLRAALAALLIHASQELLVPTPSCSTSLRSGIGARARPLRIPALISRERCRVSRGCTNTNIGEGSEVARTSARGGDEGGEDGVHTLLIDNYDSYTYNLFQLLAVVNGRAPFVVYNDDDGGNLWRAIERMGYMPDNIVISPGPGRPDRPKDFGMCAQALGEATDIPILGVCLGHEGLGIAHGARVVRASEPMHGRLSPVFHDGEDALFRGIPQGSKVVRYHSLVVDRDTLPVGGALRATAWTDDGVLMAMRHEEHPHWGVQFHPESVGTRHGSDIVRNFRDLTVAWRNKPATRGGGIGGGGGCGVSSKNGPRLSTEVSRGVVRNGWGQPRATVGEVASGGQRPALASSVACGNDGEATEGASVSSVDGGGRVCNGRGSTAGKKQPFVLHVKVVDMVDGVSKDGEVGRNPDNSRQRTFGASPAAMPDTEHAFRTLYGDDATAWWLDSSSQRPGLAVGGQAKARFTFMGGVGGPLSKLIECYGKDRLVVEHAGGGGNGNGGEKDGDRWEVRANILDYLKAEMSKMGLAEHSDKKGIDIRVVGEPAGHEDCGVHSGGEALRARDDGDDDHQPTTLPFDFMGGFVGFLGYELRHEANNVLVRSAGGTEWDWQPSGGGKWEEVDFEKTKVVQPGADSPAGSVVEETMADGLGGDAKGFAAPRGGDGNGGGDVPLGFLVFVDRFVAFDHREGKAYVLALTHSDGHSPSGELRDPGGGGPSSLPTDHKKDTITSNDDAEGGGNLDWMHRTAASLLRMSSSGGRVVDDTPAASAAAAAAAAANGGKGMTTACIMDVPRARYEQSLEDIMRLVAEGETYEVCLTNQIVCERPKGDGATKISPLDLYSRLRRTNPAPYAAFIVHDPHRRLSPSSFSSSSLGGDGEPQEDENGNRRPSFAVCCSSPEKFIKVDGHGWVESKPIKGTVKRGKTPAEDLLLATDLAKGEKNMAENLMIVDLVRNDLGRVCQTGSVSVPKLMHVESYATVHQLVSTIRGRLKPNCGALDAVAAAFPGGSMTGAPKQRTMEIIDRLERGRSRGIYSGSIGFLGVDGAADFNIVIRTAVVTPQNVTVGAGGAVIALSEVDDEYDEMLLKATSVLGALGHEKRPGHRGPPGSEPTTAAQLVELTNVPPAEDKRDILTPDKNSEVRVLPGRRGLTSRNGDGRRLAEVKTSMGRGGVIRGEQQREEEMRRQKDF